MEEKIDTQNNTRLVSDLIYIAQTQIITNNKSNERLQGILDNLKKLEGQREIKYGE